jgi:hypothetical protein
MKPDALAYELLKAIQKTQIVGGTSIRVVENFCDGIVEIDGPLPLIEIAKQILARLHIQEIKNTV